MKRCAGVLGTLLFVGLFASCSDETKDNARDTARSARRDIENAVDSTAATAAAEAMRAVLLAKDLPDGTTVRDTAILEDAADDLPGHPRVDDIDDRDGDGKDDDGKVEIVVGDRSACLTAQDNGEIDVSGHAC